MHYRLATENDAEVLLAIYSQYIEDAKAEQREVKKSER